MLSRRVVYTSQDGFEKAGLIIGTRDSIKPGTGVSRPDEDAAHIEVHAPTGKVYVRENVRLGTGPGTFRLR